MLSTNRDNLFLFNLCVFIIFAVTFITCWIGRVHEYSLTLSIHWEDWCWSWNSSTLATWCEELTPWKRPWCWERLKAGGERDNRGWDGWMASPTQWTWVWVNSRSWWWTGRPGVLQFMGSQWLDTTEWLNWTEEGLEFLDFRGKTFNLSLLC